jgi:hypothetical protein
MRPVHRVVSRGTHEDSISLADERQLLPTGVILVRADLRRVSGFGFRVPGLGLGSARRHSGFGVWGLGFGVWGLGFVV